jgi:hypothetical protein
MTTRRDLVILPVAVALAGMASSARGQAVSAPAVESLRPLLASPAGLQPTLDGVMALRTLLVYSLIRDRAVAPDAHLRDREPLVRLLQSLQQPERLASARAALQDAPKVRAATSATERAQPTAQRLQKRLHADGLAEGSPYSNYLLQSFLRTNQVEVLTATAPAGDQPWYCRIYPFSVFCG